MPSGKGNPGETIVGLVNELDRSVREAEDALIGRAWPTLEALLADQQRLTHAISNEIAHSEGKRPEAFDGELKRRLASIEDRRSDQMRRLEAFHHAVGSRLSVMARAKAMRRATRPSDALDRPALLDSLR